MSNYITHETTDITTCPGYQVCCPEVTHQLATKRATNVCSDKNVFILKLCLHGGRTLVRNHCAKDLFVEYTPCARCAPWYIYSQCVSMCGTLVNRRLDWIEQLLKKKGFHGLTHWPLGDIDAILLAILKQQFLISFYWLVFSYRLRIMPWDECQGTSSMISQHWIR